MTALALVGLGTFLVNVPFGFWRGGARRFSWRWFLAVHAPVPLVAAMRYLAGVHWSAVTFPILIGSYFAGQLLGTRLYRARV